MIFALNEDGRWVHLIIIIYRTLTSETIEKPQVRNQPLCGRECKEISLLLPTVTLGSVRKIQVDVKAKVCKISLPLYLHFETCPEWKWVQFSSFYKQNVWSRRYKMIAGSLHAKTRTFKYK